MASNSPIILPDEREDKPDFFGFDNQVILSDSSNYMVEESPPPTPLSPEPTPNLNPNKPRRAFRHAVCKIMDYLLPDGTSYDPAALGPNSCGLCDRVFKNEGALKIQKLTCKSILSKD